jgi:cell division protein FtsZ
MLGEDTRLVAAFDTSNGLLADGVRGFWQLLTHEGLIQLHFSDLCNLLRGRHSESTFAVAEACGPTRAQEVADKLLAHPMLEDGKSIAEAQTIVVSIVGAVDLTMSEVNRIVDALRHRAEAAEVMLGASVDDSFSDRLSVTVVVSRREPAPVPRLGGSPEELSSQLLPSTDEARPPSRFVPPPPALTPEELAQMAASNRVSGERPRKSGPRLRQGQLQLEIVHKGRFDKSEPTIHKGEDLDVPTYVRRGIALN